MHLFQSYEEKQATINYFSPLIQNTSHKFQSMEGSIKYFIKGFPPPLFSHSPLLPLFISPDSPSIYQCKVKEKKDSGAEWQKESAKIIYVTRSSSKTWIICLHTRCTRFSWFRKFLVVFTPRAINRKQKQNSIHFTMVWILSNISGQKER